MKTGSYLTTALLLLATPSFALPQRGRAGGRNRNGQAAQAGAASSNSATAGVNAAFDGTPVGTVNTGTASDGSIILDKTVMLKLGILGSLQFAPRPNWLTVTVDFQFGTKSQARLPNF